MADPRSPGAVRLVIRADGLGLCHAVNQAVEEGFEAGVLTCATVLAVGPWLADAAALVREHPHWPLGVLLTLECRLHGCRYGPASPSPAVRSALALPTGDFPPALPDEVSQQAVRDELAAQLDRARAWGVRPEFLAYEGELHPGVWLALGALAHERGIPSWKAWLGPAPTRLEPKPHAGESLEEAIARTVAGLSEGGAYAWVVRPAQPAPETWALWGPEEAAQRHAEARAVVSPLVKGAIDQRR
jgi:predicted glycoside hydrolase/deacetylase ChbG (UPF0249 family)